MNKEMNYFLDSGMKQTEPRKAFSKEMKRILLNIHAISYMSGRYWVKLKTENDEKTAESIERSQSFSEKLEDDFENYCVDFYAFSSLKYAFPKIPKLKPLQALAFLAEKLSVKVNAYIKKIEETLSVKIDIQEKLAFYDNAKHLRDFITSKLEEGESLKAAIKRLGKKDLLDKIGITDNNKYYLETVIRTNQVTAMSAGEHNESRTNVNVEYYQYVAIIDPRTTSVCKDLDEIVKSKSDPLWDTHLPPNHFNCRSRVITFSKSLVKVLNMKVSTRTDFEPPEKDFNNDPSKTWSMPTKDMRKRLADHTGVDYKDIPKGAIFEE